MRIATVVGSRPQFVKAAAVSPLLRQRHEEILIHTGQHYDDELSRVFFDELDIPAPEHRLEEGGGTNTSQTARMVGALESVLREISADMVLVYGDTNSTLAGALVGAQLRIPIAHIEAGMRSFDRSMPEELNRVLCDHASDLLLCSTPVAVENLVNEGVRDGVHSVGDVMADVVLSFAGLTEGRSDALGREGLDPHGYVLVTCHRAGNVDIPARLLALVAVLEALPLPAAFPVHRRTAARLAEAGLEERLDQANIHLMAPLGYLDLIKLAAKAVLTDSGGLQKEAYLLGTPCITLRERTEWVETEETGWNVLADLDRGAVLAALERPPDRERPDLYGGGRAASRILHVLDAGQRRGRLVHEGASAT